MARGICSKVERSYYGKHTNNNKQIVNPVCEMTHGAREREMLYRLFHFVPLGGFNAILAGDKFLFYENIKRDIHLWLLPHI